MAFPRRDTTANLLTGNKMARTDESPEEALGLAQLQRERAHQLLLADMQVQGGRRGDNGMQVHQANRLEAIASAVAHITGRSSFVPRRGGR